MGRRGCIHGTATGAEQCLCVAGCRTIHVGYIDRYCSGLRRDVVLVVYSSAGCILLQTESGTAAR